MKNVDLEKYGAEICLAVQEWGLKENLRLFGIKIAEMGEPGKGPETMTSIACGYFTDAGIKNKVMVYFDVNERGGKIIITRVKWKVRGYTHPMKITRTKVFANENINPVDPLYSVLIERKIILPFRGTIKQKDWLALPFEDSTGIKSVAL